MEKSLKLIKQQSGQAGLAAILVSIIMLVVGLSLASRASREALISVHEGEGTRTLEGAQTGADFGLGTLFGIGGTTEIVDSDGRAPAIAQIEGEFLEIVLDRGVSVELRNLPPHRSIPLLLTICWGAQGITGTNQAALLVSSFSTSGGNNGINASADFQKFRPHDQNLGIGATPANPGCSIGGGATLRNQVSVSSSDVHTMRIMALYNSTIVRIDAPTQAQVVRAAATNVDDAQVRVVEVRQTHPGAPTLLEYALFSGYGGISK
jgi:hypothetical protein